MQNLSTDEIVFYLCAGFVALFLVLLFNVAEAVDKQSSHESASARRKRLHGRREKLMDALKYSRWQSHYELAKRTGINFKDVSKLLSTAYRDHEPIERIKRRVDVPPEFLVDRKDGCKSQTVWVYRLKASEPYTVAKDAIRTEENNTSTQPQNRLNLS